MGMILWCASMVFGAIHLTAWNEQFPSSAEAWLWRASAICIASSGLVWLLINMLAGIFPQIDAFWDRVVAFRATWLSILLIGILCAAYGLAYVLARSFLVIEAFISIRALPAAAYDTPNWSQVIPRLQLSSFQTWTLFAASKTFEPRVTSAVEKQLSHTLKEPNVS